MLPLQIMEEIESQAEEMKDLLKKLALIPAPSYREKKRAAFCRKWLATAGAEGVYTDDAGNVVYPYGCTVQRERISGVHEKVKATGLTRSRGDRALSKADNAGAKAADSDAQADSVNTVSAHDKIITTVIPDDEGADPQDFPLIVFAAHMDTVFPDMKPMPYKEYRERIYCPGIYDDTVNLVNILLAARFVTQHHLQPKGCGILFVCNTCEEGMGNLKGTRQLFADYGDRIKEFYTFDLVYNEIVDHAVGSCRFEVTARTKGGHSYLNFGNDNAIQRMAAFIQDLYTIELPENACHQDGTDYCLPGAYYSPGATPLSGKSSFNVGLIEGGTSVNTIAQKCTALCEYRSDSAAAMEELDREFRELFEKHKLKYDVIGIRPGEKLGEAAEQRRSEMLDMTAGIVKETTGMEPTRLSSSTDCNIPLSLGIPAICIGTCLGHGAHTREEYLIKSSLLPGRMIATEVVLSYFNL